jgi:hypothetical protein
VGKGLGGEWDGLSLVGNFGDVWEERKRREGYECGRGNSKGKG